ncbi:MAG TPA: GYD domain-containing protein [Acidimicrobiales bacterium]
MPKYLIQAVYTADGAKGLLDKGGTARRKAVEAAAKSVGGSVDQFYFAFGETDVVAIVDYPDHASAAALALTVGASGAVETTTTVLLTPEELDAASKKSIEFRPPGA